MKDIQRRIQQELQQIADSKFSQLSDAQLADIDARTGQSRPEHAERLRGRERPDQSERMSGDANIMAGKVSPNRGKSMPQISERIRGRAKPQGFGEKISAAKRGRPNVKAQGVPRPGHSEAMRDPTRNRGALTMRETMTCPHCAKTANVPNYRRWHGDNCKAKT